MAVNKSNKFKIILIFEVFVVLALAVCAIFLIYMGNVKRESVDADAVNAKDIKGFTNIMLFGVDARGDELTSNTRSDTMILCSINEKTKEVTLTSFYRDYYAFSPEKAGADAPVKLDSSEFDKLTHAYNKGPQAAIKEINTNFDLDITDFVTVNFIALVRVIDELGGIEIDVPEYLIYEINRYGGEIAKKNKEKFTKVTKPGVQKLDGYQALGYSRTRKKDSDFKRSQRQREVLNKVFETFKDKASISNASAICQAISSNMATSFSNKELIRLMASAGKYKIRKETNNDYGNGFPYHAVEYKPRGISCQISKTPREDLVTLHYNLFNNGVIPDSVLAQFPSNQKDENDSSNNTSNTKSSSDDVSSEPDKKAQGSDYQYTPSATVDLITRYLESCYSSTQ